jgi:membrane associated rhomboid family serine protease
MIPLRDVIPSRTRPLATISLILASTVGFLILVLLPEPTRETFVRDYGVVPIDFDWISVPTSMFLHGGWVHFAVNTLYLWLFGENVEDRLGRGRFVAFYLLCGTAAALAHVATAPGSALPSIGAGGAIAGTMAAYLVLYPRSRILVFVPFYSNLHIAEVRAVFFVLAWFVLQLLAGVGSIVVSAQGYVRGVAIWSHMAGLLAGMVLVFIFRRPERQRVEWWGE